MSYTIPAALRASQDTVRAAADESANESVVGAKIGAKDFQPTATCSFVARGNAARGLRQRNVIFV